MPKYEAVHGDRMTEQSCVVRSLAFRNHSKPIRFVSEDYPMYVRRLIQGIKVGHIGRILCKRSVFGSGRKKNKARLQTSKAIRRKTITTQTCLATVDPPNLAQQHRMAICVPKC